MVLEQAPCNIHRFCSYKKLRSGVLGTDVTMRIHGFG